MWVPQMTDPGPVAQDVGTIEDPDERVKMPEGPQASSWCDAAPEFVSALA